MNRPLIALPAHRFAAGHTYKLEPALAVISYYVDAVWRAGGLPLPVFPNVRTDDDVEETLDHVSGVVAIGGLDVDPARYGQDPHPALMSAPQPQEDFEIALIVRAIERGIPLLAICRGAQLLNVAFGGTLDQHITDHPDLDSHGVPNGGGGTTNQYHLTPGTLGHDVMGGPVVAGRCHHHQAVDTVAPGLLVTGRTADNTVEVLEFVDPSSWMLAVQWHPEETAESDPQNQALFDALVAAARDAAVE